MIQDILREFRQPKEIHSRHEAKAHIKDILKDDEKYVYGLEKMDSLFNTYKTRWFLTETQVIFTTSSFPISFNYDVYPFEMVDDIEYFEDEQVLVIESTTGRNGIEATSEIEVQFLTQVVEQYKRYNLAVETIKEQQEKEAAQDDGDENDDTERKPKDTKDSDEDSGEDSSEDEQSEE